MPSLKEVRDRIPEIEEAIDEYMKSRHKWRIYNRNSGMVEAEILEKQHLTIKPESIHSNHDRFTVSASASYKVRVHNIDDEAFPHLFYNQKPTKVDVDNKEAYAIGSIFAFVSFDEENQLSLQYEPKIDGGHEWSGAWFMAVEALLETTLILDYDIFWDLNGEQGIVVIYVHDQEDVILRSSNPSQILLWKEMLDSLEASRFIDTNGVKGFSSGDMSDRFRRAIDTELNTD